MDFLDKFTNTWPGTVRRIIVLSTVDESLMDVQFICRTFHIPILFVAQRMFDRKNSSDGTNSVRSNTIIFVLQLLETWLGIICHFRLMGLKTNLCGLLKTDRWW